MTKQTTIGERIRELTADDEVAANRLEALLPLWRDSYKLSMELAGKAFLRLLLFFLLFVLIDSAALTKATVFGIEFANLSVPYALCFALSIVIYYRFVSLACFAQLIDEAIRHGNRQLSSRFVEEGLYDLATFPSLPQIENTLDNLERGRTFFSRLAVCWMSIEALAALFLPVLAFAWASYALVRSPLLPGAWSVPIVIVSWIVIVRTIVAPAHAVRFSE